MNGNTPQGPAPFPQEPQRPVPPQPQPGGMGGYTPPAQPPRPPMPQTPPQSPASAVPPPPPPEIGVRTMSSDISSMRQSGGMQAQPKTFKPEDLASVPVFQPQTAGSPEPKGVNKAVFVVLGSVAFALVVGLVFFFFIKPLIWPSAEEEEFPPVTGVMEPAPQSEPTVETSPPAPQFKHQSLFTPAPTISETLTFDKLALADVTAAMQKATSDSQPEATLKELVVASDKVSASNFLAVVLPDLDSKLIEANFEKDFTAFAYYDKNGVWPGYIFKLTEKGDLVSAKSISASIEKSPNLVNLYLVSPGAAKATAFKDGAPVKDNPVRYLAYSKAGASFNYAWLGNNLVLSTSYNGFKEAVKLLGF